MESNWVHRYAVILAACTLLVILSGGLLTSETRPLPGSDVSLLLMPPVFCHRLT